MQAGFSCEDVIDLSTILLDPISMDAALAVVGSDIELTFDALMTGPINQDNPGMGSLTIAGNIVARGTLPTPCCPGDLTGDDLVGPADLGRFVDCLTGPDVLTAGACQCADTTDDADVDLRDFADLQQAWDAP